MDAMEVTSYALAAGLASLLYLFAFLFCSVARSFVSEGSTRYLLQDTTDRRRADRRRHRQLWAAKPERRRHCDKRSTHERRVSRPPPMHILPLRHLILRFKQMTSPHG